jgi:hypothetical protein
VDLIGIEPMTFPARRDALAYRRIKLVLVDLIGIEPMTSSMPWNSSDRKIQTAQHLQTG